MFTFSKLFQEKYKLNLNDPVIFDIEEFGGDDENGLYHYVNIETKDVYSFDTHQKIWLKKNLHQDDVLKRLTKPLRQNANK